MRPYPFKSAERFERRYSHWHVMRSPRESVRGLIRGTSARERGLAPGPVRSRVRRILLRLLGVYASRFGQDPFVIERSGQQLGRPPRRKWLSNGYAHWRDRLANSSADLDLEPNPTFQRTATRPLN